MNKSTTLPTLPVSLPEFDETFEFDFALCHGSYFYCRYCTGNYRIGA
jgi:hypothetical protein